MRRARGAQRRAHSWSQVYTMTMADLFGEQGEPQLPRSVPWLAVRVPDD